MASLEEIRAARIAKLELLKQAGIDPYPIESKRELSLHDVAEHFTELERKGEKWLAGRVMSIRGQGALIFVTLDDGTGRFQLVIKKDVLGEEAFELFNSAADIGDVIEAHGSFFTTQRGEKSLETHAWRMLSKSLRPLPEKWHGLQDVEERFRKRYLDTLSNAEVRARFHTRSKIITKIREILDRAGFLEVETPALQPLYGGASAEPFVTHHNALDSDLYLRISDELYLKRLLAGGFSRVYEIARDFRNEGIDTTHNPEFTMLEFYEAYADAAKERTFVERILREVAFMVNPSGIISYSGREIDFNRPFMVKKYADVFAEYTTLKDALHASEDELIREAKSLDAHFSPDESRVKILDAIFKKIRPNLIEPTFLIDYPVDYLPLTKRKPEDSTLVDAFQLYAGGLELVKAFSELNDPLDQRTRLEREEEKKEGETQPLDEDFLEAMEYGIPPAGGVGIGIDRLTMFFTDTTNIKEVILFPTLKPKQD